MSSIPYPVFTVLQGRKSSSNHNNVYPSPEVDVLIKVLDGKTICLTLKHPQTIRHLMGLIHHHTQIPVQLQKLISNGTHLDPTKSLDHYNITTGSVIHLMLSLCGGSSNIKPPITPPRSNTEPTHESDPESMDVSDHLWDSDLESQNDSVQNTPHQVKQCQTCDSKIQIPSLIAIGMCKPCFLTYKEVLTRNPNKNVHSETPITVLDPDKTPRTEEGVVFSFDNKVDAQQYAKISQGRKFPHKYNFLRSKNNGRKIWYRCKLCKSERILVEKNGKYLVNGHWDHTHDDWPNNVKLSAAQLQIIRTHGLILSASVLKAIHRDKFEGITIDQLRAALTYQRAKMKKKLDGTIEDWVNVMNKGVSIGLQPNPGNLKIIGSEFKDMQLVVITSDNFLKKLICDHKLFTNSVSMDSRSGNLATAIVTRLGLTDKKHKLFDVCYAVNDGKEQAKVIFTMLKIITKYIRDNVDTLFTPTEWMLDGSDGFRDAVQQWYEWIVTQTKNDPNVDDEISSLIIAMCYFHVVHSCRRNKKLLPNPSENIRSIIGDIRRLARCTPKIFPFCWKTVNEKWNANGWHRFLSYFESTWIDKLPNWNVLVRGLGEPRVNNSLEGNWPTFDIFLPGALHITPFRMLNIMWYFILPTIIDNQNTQTMSLVPRDPTIDEIRWAIDMYQKGPKDGRLIELDGQYYCKMDSYNETPVISNSNILQYNRIFKEIKTLTYDDFRLITSIITFNDLFSTDETYLLDGMSKYLVCGRLFAGESYEDEKYNPMNHKILGRPRLQPFVNKSPSQLDFMCIICNIDCQNLADLQSHLMARQTANKHHYKNMTELWDILNETQTDRSSTRWRDTYLLSLDTLSQLKAGATILVPMACPLILIGYVEIKGTQTYVRSVVGEPIDIGCWQIFNAKYIDKSDSSKEVHRGANADYVCSKCSDSFKSRGVFNTHQIWCDKHTEQAENTAGENRCVFCERIFTNKGGVTSHQYWCKNNPNRRRVSTIPDTSDSCHICNSKFDSIGGLQSHIVWCGTKSKEKKFNTKYQCEICGEKFRTDNEKICHQARPVIREENHDFGLDLTFSTGQMNGPYPGSRTWLLCYALALYQGIVRIIRPTLRSIDCVSINIQSQQMIFLRYLLQLVSSNTSLDPRKLHSSLKIDMKYGQQDSNELLDQLCAKKCIPELLCMFGITECRLVECPTTRSFSFTGRKETASCLNLAIGDIDDNRIYDIDDLLDQHYQPEKIKDFKCEATDCDGKCSPILHTRLMSPTGPLIIFLKRFEYTAITTQKILAEVKFHKRQQFLIWEQDSKTMKSIYLTLEAVLIHKGQTLNAGHYYTYGRHPYLDTWSKFNDDKVTSSTWDIISSETKDWYALFYNRESAQPSSQNTGTETRGSVVDRGSAPSSTQDTETASTQDTGSHNKLTGDVEYQGPKEITVSLSQYTTQFLETSRRNKSLWVQTRELWQFREYDRRVTPKYEGVRYLDELRRWFSNEHLNVIILSYPQEIRSVCAEHFGLIHVDMITGMAYLNEGNHRLLISMEYGIPFFPIQCFSLPNVQDGTETKCIPLKLLSIWQIKDITNNVVTMQYANGHGSNINIAVDLPQPQEYTIGYSLTTWNLMDLIHSLHINRGDDVPLKLNQVMSYIQRIKTGRNEIIVHLDSGWIICLVEKKELGYHIKVFDPRVRSSRCNKLLDLLHNNKENDVKVTYLGWQTKKDAWREGYYILYILFVLRTKCSLTPLNKINIPGRPNKFENIIWGALDGYRSLDYRPLSSKCMAQIVEQSSVKKRQIQPRGNVRKVKNPRRSTRSKAKAPKRQKITKDSQCDDDSVDSTEIE